MAADRWRVWCGAVRRSAVRCSRPGKVRCGTVWRLHRLRGRPHAGIVQNGHTSLVVSGRPSFMRPQSSYMSDACHNQCKDLPCTHMHAAIPTHKGEQAKTETRRQMCPWATGHKCTGGHGRETGRCRQCRRAPCFDRRGTAVLRMNRTRTTAPKPALMFKLEFERKIRMSLRGVWGRRWVMSLLW